MAEGNANNMLEFLKLMGKLKHLKRAGWANRGIENGETVAGHMYRMAIMTFLLPEDSKLDRNLCMKLALVHDIAECMVGDITPEDGVPVDEKKRREVEACKELMKLLPESTAAEIDKLFNQYISYESPEAKFVKELDRFDMVLQAAEYEETTDVDLQVFFDAVKGKFRTSFLLDMKKILDSKRNKKNKSSQVALNNPSKGAQTDFQKKII